MNKLVKRLLTGTLAFATILTALPVTAVHASGNQYWTESAERVGYIEHVMNDGSIKSTFNEGHMKVEGETAYCVDINTNFKNGYKTRSLLSKKFPSDLLAHNILVPKVKPSRLCRRVCKTGKPPSPGYVWDLLGIFLYCLLISFSVAKRSSPSSLAL